MRYYGLNSVYVCRGNMLSNFAVTDLHCIFTLTVLVHFCWCFFKSRFSIYFLAHFEHIYFLSVCCDCTWMDNSPPLSNSVSQYLHIMEQVRSCRKNMSFLLNVLKHLSHEKDPAPWTDSLCLFKSEFLEKILEQTWHWNSIVKMNRNASNTGFYKPS